MTLYELIKKYGTGKGEDMMWKSVRVISDAVDTMLDEQARNKLLKKVYGAISSCHYNEEYALADVTDMFYIDESGNEHFAPYWTPQQVRVVYDSVSGELPESYNMWDFYVALQMQKSDLCPMLRRWFPNDTPEQMDKRIIEATVNWMNDEDNPYSDRKVWWYVNSMR